MQTPMSRIKLKSPKIRQHVSPQLWSILSLSVQSEK